MISAGESLKDSIELATGDGYLASFGIYHEIHYLVSLSLFNPPTAVLNNKPITNLEFHHL